MKKHVAVLLANYNQKKYLPACFASLQKQTQKADRIYYVDNASTDGSLEFVKNKYPNVVAIVNDTNEGFAKAVNRGMRRVFRDGFRFCVLLNPDIVLDRRLLHHLIETYQTSKKSYIKIGLIQPILLLASDKDKINSIGNAIHYLGFGYCRDYLKKYRSINKDQEIAFASGAVMLISKDYYHSVGKLDESFFLYCDDQDYSWRGSIAGYRHYLSVQARAYHDYAFSRYTSKMYHFEKNRWTMLLKNYSVKTLILLIPALLAVEITLLLYSSIHGFFFGKLKAYWYTLTHLNEIIKKRIVIQSKRTNADKIVIQKFDAGIYFFLLRKMPGIDIINFVLSLYYRIMFFVL